MGKKSSVIFLFLKHSQKKQQVMATGNHFTLQYMSLQLVHGEILLAVFLETFLKLWVGTHSNCGSWYDVIWVVENWELLFWKLQTSI